MPGRTNSKSKGAEVKAYSVCLRNSKEASEAEEGEGCKGRELEGRLGGGGLIVQGTAATGRRSLDIYLVNE